jgi:hypothetical protein
MGKCSKTKWTLFGERGRGRGEKTNLLRYSKHENKWK